MQCVADLWRDHVNLGDCGRAVGLDIVAAPEEALPALRPVDLCRRLVPQLSLYHGRHDYDSGQHVGRFSAHVLRRTRAERELGNCRGYSIGKNDIKTLFIETSLQGVLVCGAKTTCNAL